MAIKKIEDFLPGFVSEIPPGIVFAFASGTIIQNEEISVPGYLLCDGSTISRTTYSNLFTSIGTLYGAGDGSTTFKIPDFRGKFLRGYLSETSDEIGVLQSDAIRNITGRINNIATNSADADGALYYIAQAGGTSIGGGSNVYTLGFDASKDVPTAAENRPVNYAIQWIIKY